MVAIQMTTSPDHLSANAAVFDVELTAEEMLQVADAAPGLSTRLYDLDPAAMQMNPF